MKIDSKALKFEMAKYRLERLVEGKPHKILDVLENNGIHKGTYYRCLNSEAMGKSTIQQLEKMGIKGFVKE